MAAASRCRDPRWSAPVAPNASEIPVALGERERRLAAGPGLPRTGCGAPADRPGRARRGVGPGTAPATEITATGEDSSARAERLESAR